MTNIFLFGINGKMGRAILECENDDKNIKIVGGFDTYSNEPCGIYNKVSKVDVAYDVIIDFSRPEALDSIIELSSKTPRPVVLATTGYEQKSIQKIHDLSRKIPVFFSGNMSVGINVLLELAQRATFLLGGKADIEIIEKHHNQKVDAPSGTAKMIVDKINTALPSPAKVVYGREGNAKRQDGEIGVHAVRGGSVVGEHEISFYMGQEIITLSHSASSRKIFALGAIAAARFLQDKKAGLYSMQDMLG